MSNQILFLFVVLFFGNAWSQQPLIGVKEGQWVLIDQDKITRLPAEFYDVGDFDKAGLTYFAVAGKYGVLNSKGEVRIPAQYSRIQSLGYGYFGTLTEQGGLLIHLTSEGISIDSCSQWEISELNWVVVSREKSKYLMNVQSSQRWNLDSMYTIDQHQFGYFSIADSSDFVTYYDPAGVPLNSETESVSMYSNYVRLKRNSEDRIITENQSYLLPEGVLKLEYTDNFIQYSTAEFTVRKDPGGKVLLNVPYQDVLPGGHNRFIVQKNFKYGVLDSSGAVLIPAMYEWLEPYGDMYLADTDEGTGVLTNTGTLVVPCKFSAIRQKGALYEVEVASGLKGLYSTLSNKFLLEPKFKEIAVSEDKVRGWLNSQLQIVSYNEKHEITGQITLDNAVSRYGLAGTRKEFDKRLFSVGWFYTAQPIYDAQGFTSGESIRWGIRSMSDSLISEPRYPTPIYVPEMNFSLISLGKKSFNWMGMEKEKLDVFGGIELTQGKNMNIQLISVDTLDGLSRDFVRFSSMEGLGYITQDNKANKVLHIDYQDDELIRFAVSETNEIVPCEEKEPEGVQLSNFDWSPKGKGARTFFSNRKESKFVQLPGAKWNYLTPSGTSLFDTPYDFADRFKYNTAIVKLDGNWGVTTKDSLIVPLAFSRIDRLPELGDSIFRVMKSQGGLRFLDHRSNEIPFRIERLIKMMGEYAIVQSNGQQAIINGNYEIVSPVGTTFRALTDRYFYTRVDRENQIFDSHGKLLMTLDAKPVSVLNDALVVAEGGNKLGLIAGSGDTIAPFQFDAIESFGNFIVASSKQNNWLLDRDGSLLEDLGSSKVLVDSVNNNYAFCNGGKVSVFNETGKRIYKAKKMFPDVFVGNCLIETGSGGRCLKIDEDTLVLPISVKEVIAVETYGYIFETRSGCYYFDRNWRCHTSAWAAEKIDYLGSGVVRVKTSGERFLFSPTFGKTLTKGRPVGEFGNELLLIESERKYHYIALNFTEVFDTEYSGAKPFKDGYAAVKMNRGWTIIDANGYNKSLDSYGEIDVHGNGLFSTSQSALFGLFDSAGNEILPVEYERIKVMESKVIQAVKNGEIYYFKPDGSPIRY